MCICVFLLSLNVQCALFFCFFLQILQNTKTNLDPQLFWQVQSNYTVKRQMKIKLSVTHFWTHNEDFETQMKCVRMEPLCAGVGALSGWWTGHKELLREQGYWPRTAAQRAHLSWLTPLFFRRWLHPGQGSSSLLAALFTGEASKQGLRHLCFTLINLKSFKKRAAQTDRQQLVRLWASARCVFK